MGIAHLAVFQLGVGETAEQRHRLPIVGTLDGFQLNVPTRGRFLQADGQLLIRVVVGDDNAGLARAYICTAIQQGMAAFVQFMSGDALDCSHYGSGIGCIRSPSSTVTVCGVEAHIEAVAKVAVVSRIAGAALNGIRCPFSLVDGREGRQLAIAHLEVEVREVCAAASEDDGNIAVIQLLLGE